jgi:hypothetical protein
MEKEKIETIERIKDYRLKPLKKFQRPYFSPRTGSCEIDYMEGRFKK